MGNTTKQYSISFPPQVVVQIDKFVNSTNLYTSRNEFVREAVREHLSQARLAFLKQTAKELADQLKSRGVTAKDLKVKLTDAEKTELVEGFDRMKGFRK